MRRRSTATALLQGFGVQVFCLWRAWSRLLNHAMRAAFGQSVLWVHLCARTQNKVWKISLKIKLFFSDPVSYAHAEQQSPGNHSLQNAESPMPTRRSLATLLLKVGELVPPGRAGTSLCDSNGKQAVCRQAKSVGARQWPRRWLAAADCCRLCR